jgi:hypothetical protein
MPGTRTAPTVDGNQNALNVTLHWIDSTGEKRADSILCVTTATPAQIEAYAAAAQAMSNASLYKVTVKNEYTSTPQKSSASATVYENVGDSIVVQFKDAVLNTSQRGYIPSADNDVAMIVGTENVDPASTEMLAYLAALNALLPTNYAPVGARFSERRDINEQTKF